MGRRIIWDDPADHLQDLCVPAAVRVTKQFFQYVEYEDILQEVRCYVLTHPKLVTELQEAYDTGETEQVKWVARKIMARMRRHAERYARKQKAAWVGYRPEDEYFYDLHKIAILIPAVINFERTATVIVERPNDSVGQPRGKATPSEGNNLLAMIIDVKRVFEQLPAEDQQLLEQYYVLEMSMAALATAWNTSKSTIDRRLKRLLRNINAGLGGMSPY